MTLTTAKIELIEDDICIDEDQIPFGIHHITWSATNGLCGNGKEIKLRGACIHHDNGLLGACEFKESAYRRIRILKETGYNAVRMAHHPPSRFLLQACDELGIQTGEQLILYLKTLDNTRPVLNCMHVLTANSKPSKKPLKPHKHSQEEIVYPRRTGKASPLVGSKLVNLIATFLPKLSQMITPRKWESNMQMAMEKLDIVGINYGTHLTKEGYQNNTNRIILHSETYPSYISKSWPIVKSIRI